VAETEDGTSRPSDEQSEFVSQASPDSSSEPSLYYAAEKLDAAVRKLAVGTESIKARLADAYIELAILQETDFPAELVGEWRRILTDLTSGKMQYSTEVRDGQIVRVPVGLLYSTLRYMRKRKAAEIAQRILDLKAKLDYSFEDSHPEAM